METELLPFAIQLAPADFRQQSKNLDLNTSLTWPPISIIPTVFYSLKRVLFIPVIHFERFGHPARGLADLVSSLGPSNGSNYPRNMHIRNLLTDASSDVSFTSPCAFILSVATKMASLTAGSGGLQIGF
jgi:hypothetical protein